MPSGFTYKALVGWCTTDNTAAPFNIEEFTQRDAVYTWSSPQKVGTGIGSSTTSAVNLSNSGTLGYSVCTPGLTNEVWGKTLHGNTYWFAHPVTFADGLSAGNSVVVWESSVAGAGNYMNYFRIPITESQTFYHQIPAGGGTADIWISGFVLGG